MPDTNSLWIRPSANNMEIPANTYEFGIGPASTAVVDHWQDNNFFTNLADGAYYWVVRRKDNHQLVRNGFQAVGIATMSDALQAKSILPAMNDTGRTLLCQTLGQTVFQVGVDEPRRILHVQGIRQVLDRDYNFSGPNLIWTGDFQLIPGISMILAYF